jgi:hypothetical protein
MLNIDHQAEMWAVLCAPPEQFNELIELFDNMEFKKKFKRTSFAWNTIDPDEVVRKFRVACVEYAMVMARKVQPTPTPDYWQTVEDSCRQVIDALNGNGDLVAARAAADAAVRAAYAAARAAAAYAAARAAYAAARAAAYAADAAAARAAAYAAADAAAAARAAAEADLSEIFINIILSEYENKD